MTPIEKVMIIGTGAVFLYAVGGYQASKRYGFAYRRLAAASSIICAVVGFIGCHISDFGGGVLAATLVGMAFTTFRWFVSGQIDSGQPVNEIVFVLLFSGPSLSGAGAGAVGAGLALGCRSLGG